MGGRHAAGRVGDFIQTVVERMRHTFAYIVWVGAFEGLFVISARHSFVVVANPALGERPVLFWITVFAYCKQA